MTDDLVKRLLAAAPLAANGHILREAAARIAELENAQSSQQGAVASEDFWLINRLDLLHVMSVAIGAVYTSVEDGAKRLNIRCVPADPHATDSDRRDAEELAPSFTSPLTPYGLLVRALRIVAGTTLYEMAKSLSSTPAKLSAIEFGREQVMDAMVTDVAAFFSSKGVPHTLPALSAALSQMQEPGGE